MLLTFDKIFVFIFPCYTVTQSHVRKPLFHVLLFYVSAAFWHCKLQSSYCIVIFILATLMRVMTCIGWKMILQCIQLYPYPVLYILHCTGSTVVYNTVTPSPHNAMVYFSGPQCCAGPSRVLDTGSSSFSGPSLVDCTITPTPPHGIPLLLPHLSPNFSAAALLLASFR